jgi:hypothetical protein
MKPSDKQIKVIEFLEQQLQFWKHTNDIGSPTHIGDISEFSRANLYDVFSEDEIKDLDSITTDLYLSITEIEQNQPKLSIDKQYPRYMIDYKFLSQKDANT